MEQPGYVGFANLPNQVHRKSVKKGFEFTLMVVGESGLGKSTLVNSLFLTDLYPERVIPDSVGELRYPISIAVGVDFCFFLIYSIESPLQRNKSRR